MITCIRTNSTNIDFQKLVTALDKDLAIRDGEEHTFYAQFNKIDAIQYAMVAYENNEAVGCGAIKAYESDTIEVKRMFVDANKRGQGIAAIILEALELGHSN